MTFGKIGAWLRDNWVLSAGIAYAVLPDPFLGPVDDLVVLGSTALYHYKLRK